MDLLFKLKVTLTVLLEANGARWVGEPSETSPKMGKFCKVHMSLYIEMTGKIHKTPCIFIYIYIECVYLQLCRHT